MFSRSRNFKVSEREDWVRSTFHIICPRDGEPLHLPLMWLVGCRTLCLPSLTGHLMNSFPHHKKMSEWSWINSVLIKQRAHCLSPLVYSCQTRSCAGWRTAGDSFPRVLTARHSRQPRRGWLSLMRRHFRVGHLGRALHSRQVKRSTEVLGTIQPSPLPSPLKQERDLVTN